MAPTPAEYFNASSFDTYVPISRQQSIWQTTGCLSMILGEEPSHGTCLARDPTRYRVHAIVCPRNIPTRDRRLAWTLRHRSHGSEVPRRDDVRAEWRAAALAQRERLATLSTVLKLTSYRKFVE